ncbi:hypothetical protein [Clostridium sp.]|uniref:hypothetical protein n=1 Tax=Clostridium sp. TaxID=1506 RepID=UPI002FCA4BD8
MVWSLFKVEIKRHFPLLGSFILIDLVLSFMVLAEVNSFYNIQFMVSSGIWFLVVIYIFIDIYRDFYIGDNSLIHMLPMRLITVFIVKLMVFSLYLILLWSTNLVFQLFWDNGIYFVRIQGSTNSLEGLHFFIIPRIVSIFSGIILIGAAISMGKLFKNIYISSVSIFLVISSVTYGILSLMKFNLIGQGNVLSTIAINAYGVFKQYAGLVTYYVVSEVDHVDIVKTIHWNNVWVNMVVGVIGLVLIYRITESKKYEIYGK